MRIWKFPIEITDEQQFVWPVDRYYPLVGLDPMNTVCMWVQADWEGVYEEEVVTIYVVGTGNPVPPDSFHVGSVSTGAFVWHVYEKDTARDPVLEPAPPRFLGGEA